MTLGQKMVEKTWNGRIRTRITMWKFRCDNSTRNLSLNTRKWQEVIWIVMIGAQKDDNTRNMPQCPHFHFGIYPCLHQTFILYLQELNTPAETVLPWSPGPWRSPGLWPWRPPAPSVHSSVPCFSYEIISDLLIWYPVWLKKKKQMWILSVD